MELIQNFWTITNQLAIYLIVGIVVAGLLKHYIKKEFISTQLDGSLISIFKATLLGIPLPLCSCSVIPFVSSLKTQGAKSAPLLSFTISTPITGVDSIMVTYAVFGWFFTLYRVISAIVISLVVGMMCILINKKEKPIKLKQEKISIKFDIKQIWHNIIDIARDIAKPLLLGLIIASLITTFLPSNISDYISQNIWLNYIIVLLISMPLYVCATASIPLGLALLAGGFSYGSMFVFLSAGPATNIITIMVVKKLLGTKNLILYLSSVIILSILGGYLLDTIFVHYLIDITSTAQEHESLSIFSQISTIILIISMLLFLIPKKQNSCTKSNCCD